MQEMRLAGVQREVPGLEGPHSRVQSHPQEDHQPRGEKDPPPVRGRRRLQMPALQIHRPGQIRVRATVAFVSLAQVP